MVVYNDEIATIVTTGVSITWANPTTGASYNAPSDGRLRQLILLAGGDAATSLLEVLLFKVKCSLWPADVIVGVPGAGIRTAPAFPIPEGKAELDLPIKSSIKLTVQYKFLTADTPVTPQAILIGVFEE